MFRANGFIFLRCTGDPEYPLVDYGQRGAAYEPGTDHPYTVPSTVVFGTNCDMSDLGWAGDHVLDPATTYYNDGGMFDTHSRVLYVDHDVTALLRPGANAIGVMLGHGWYSAEGDIPPAPSHRTPYDDQPVTMLQMNIQMKDGATVQIVGDGS